MGEAPHHAKGLVVGEAPQSKVRAFLWYVMPAVAYAAAIFLGGSIRISAAPSVEHGDKIVHALAFGGMQVLAFRALYYERPGMGRLAQLGWGVAAAGTVGGLLEIFQAFIPYRSADVLDWIADLVGAVVAAVVLRFVLRVSRRSGDAPVTG
jgi:VanZ family protein